MFPRCFTPAFRAIWVQKEELKRSIMGEAKFVPNRLWIKSYQKMNSWCSQVSEGIKECKHGINLFIQREHRERKWPRNFVSLLLFRAVMKEIFWCFINSFSLLLKMHCPAGLHEGNQLHFRLFKNSAVLFVWRFVIFQQWWVEIQQSLHALIVKLVIWTEKGWSSL